MIRYLLDTDVCIHAIRKRTKAVADLLQQRGHQCAVSDITLYELYFGAESYDAPTTRIAVIEEFVTDVRVLPFNTEAARHAGHIRASLRKNGAMIGNSEILIAAIARSLDLILLTGNVSEFTRIDGLKIETWR